MHWTNPRLRPRFALVRGRHQPPGAAFFGIGRTPRRQEAVSRLFWRPGLLPIAHRLLRNPYVMLVLPMVEVE